MMVVSEAWPVLSNSLERTVEQKAGQVSLRAMSSQTVRQQHLLTQIMMPLVERFKCHTLNSYSGTVLGLLTGRGRPYSADEMAHFLLSEVQVGWAEEVTVEVTRWATQLWARDDGTAQAEAEYVYWDWHVKAVYSDYHLPRTKHGTSDRIVGARKQLMLHDKAGHLLLLRTYRGDTHLIEGMIDGTAYYEGVRESRRLSHQIFDREGLSVAHCKELLTAEDKREFITCLKANQYDGLSSFELCGSFAPYRYNKKGQLVQEIAEAKYELKDRRKSQEALPLRAIVLRRPAEEIEDEVVEEEEEEERLFAMITPNWERPASEIADLYRARQTKQENAIRDWWLSLGGDVNIGYDKQPVENSELAAQKEELVARLARLTRYIPGCQKRLGRVQRRHQRHIERYQAEWEAARQTIYEGIEERETADLAALDIYHWAQAEEARFEELLTPLLMSIEETVEEIAQEQQKQTRYLTEQKEKQQTLTKITRQMVDQPMYELDDRKDQLISALRVCLVNVLQLLRDTVFPTSYAQATYETLKPFVQMGGFVIEYPEYIQIFLDGFWQSAKQRELTEVVARCNAQRFTTPDGRLLKFDICSLPGHI
jgi:hypothetical protein